MYRFENTTFLYALLAVPILAVLLIVVGYLQRKNKNRFAHTVSQHYLFTGNSVVKKVVRLILFLLGLTFLLVAMANLQLGTKTEEVKKTGIDIMVCLDVSNSMRAEDFPPDRLEHAKRALQKLLDKLKGDRLGLIVFGGDAYVQLPLTSDYNAARMYFPLIDPEMVPTQGTAIGTAIDLAVKSFPENSKNKRAIIVISDGENHEDDAVKAAESANEAGIRVFTIGMGSPEGTPIPDLVNGRKAGFKKDKEGHTVISRLNEQLLIDVANAGKGAYVRSTASQARLSTVYKELSGMEKNVYGTLNYADYEGYYQWFAAVGLLLVLVEFLFSNKRGTWFNTQNEL